MDLQLDGAALTAWLVDTPSVSGDEGPLTDAIEAALRPLPHLTVHRDGNTIVARTTLGRPERVILAGHVDTVPVAGNLPSRVEGPRLYGCGTSDMKAGVAVQLRLAAGLTSPGRDVTYVFYDCEEVAADRNGLLRLSGNSPELLAGDFAVLMEPSSAEIEGGCQGTLRAEIVVPGQRAHTARSWMGRNAIHDAAAVLDVLRGYTPREPEVDGLRYHEGLNAVGIRGGVAGNVVPDECAVTVNYRFAPDLSGEQAAEYVESLFSAGQVTDPRRRRRRPAGPRPAGRGRVRRGGRRDAAAQARLDRRGQVLRPRHPGGELRPRHLGDRAHARRVRGDRQDRRVRGPPPVLAGRLRLAGRALAQLHLGGVLDPVRGSPTARRPRRPGGTCR